MTLSTSSAGTKEINSQHKAANQPASYLQDLRDLRAPDNIGSAGRSSRVRAFHPTVQIMPDESIKRLGTGRAGWFVETIHASVGKRMELQFQGPTHLLVMYNEGARRNGETSIDGLLPSNNRNLMKRLTFVPAGRGYRERLETAACTRLTFLYLDPSILPSDGESEYAPRLHVEDPVVWETAAKLKNAIENGRAKRTLYLSALSRVLAFELSHGDHDAACDTALNRGGLASWQERVAVGYIEEHLSERIGLVTLAQLVNLSHHHFCRAFKRSFGVPPHQYQMQGRIERAKLLLADHTISITEIGLTVGYDQTSSFSSAFRKMTGRTPTEYRREFKWNVDGRCI